MIMRHVPAGTEGDFAGAPYETVGSLPAIIAKRQANRGIEAVAVSPDERFLYFIMQNPLANPDSAAFQKARNTRLFKLERATMRVVGEYVYTLDDPQSFRRDPSSKQSDPRISEMMAVGLDRLIIDERTELTTKLYEVELIGATNIAGSKYDGSAPIAPNGKLEPEIIPAVLTSFIDINDNAQLAKFGLHNGPPNDRTNRSEKWEAMGLVPALDRANPGKYETLFDFSPEEVTPIDSFDNPNSANVFSRSSRMPGDGRGCCPAFRRDSWSWTG
jgi:hypothetical protein